MICAQDVVPRRLRMPFVLIVGIGVITTFSRSAMLGWILVLLVTAFRRGHRLKSFLNWFAIGVLMLAFLASPVWTSLQNSLQQRGLITLDIKQRFEFFRGGGLNESSADAREGRAKLALHNYLEHPVLGTGTGTAVEPLRRARTAQYVSGAGT